jgi:hypothetical protein
MLSHHNIKMHASATNVEFEFSDYEGMSDWSPNSVRAACAVAGSAGAASPLPRGAAHGRIVNCERCNGKIFSNGATYLRCKRAQISGESEILRDSIFGRDYRAPRRPWDMT